MRAVRAAYTNKCCSALISRVSARQAVAVRSFQQAATEMRQGHELHCPDICAENARCTVHLVDHKVAGYDHVAQLAVLKHEHPSPADTPLSGRGKGPRVRGKRPARITRNALGEAETEAGTTFTWETQHPRMSGRPSGGLQ